MEPVATGSIRVTLAGNGPFGYSVWLSTGASLNSSGSAPVVFTGLPPGTYTLHLNHVSCRAVDSNPKTVVVTATAQTDVAFTVACETGHILASTTTTGENPPHSLLVYVTEQNDPWCYSYECETQEAQPNGTIRFERRFKVPHSVWLLNLPRNCTADPPDHEGVTPDSAVAFALVCR